MVAGAWRSGKSSGGSCAAPLRAYSWVHVEDFQSFSYIVVSLDRFGGTSIVDHVFLGSCEGRLAVCRALDSPAERRKKTCSHRLFFLRLQVPEQVRLFSDHVLLKEEESQQGTLKQSGPQTKMFIPQRLCGANEYL